MREKMTYFSREIARNARNQMYQFWAVLECYLAKIWVIFNIEVLRLKSKVVFHSYLMSFWIFNSIYLKNDDGPKSNVIKSSMYIREKWFTTLKKLYLKNDLKFGQIEVLIVQKLVIFSRNFSRRISREKCLAKPFFVLSRNARNVPVYLREFLGISNWSFMGLGKQFLSICPIWRQFLMKLATF